MTQSSGLLPMADAIPQGMRRDKVVSQVRRKFSGSLANDTKWNELITYFRNAEGWRPSYRSKWVTGQVSGWDAEWFYHLPFPFVGVEWFDISLRDVSSERDDRQIDICDHRSAIVQKIAEIGFEHEVRGDVVRIWGYAPKSNEDFPPGAGNVLFER